MRKRNQKTRKHAGIGWDILAAVLASLGPLSLSLFWHLKNERLWGADAQRYLTTIQLGYLSWRENGIFSGFAASYERLFQTDMLGTMVHQVLALPFAIMAEGKLLATVALFNGASFSVFLGYGYALARTRLPIGRAVLATLFAGTIPHVLGSTHLFMSELPLLAAGTASLYHLVRSEHFSNARHSLLAGLWIAGAVCVRPAEGTFLFVLPLVAALAIGLRKKHVSRSDLLAATAAATLVTAGAITRILVDWDAFPSIGAWIAWTITILAVAAFACRAKLGLSTNFAAALSVFTCLVALWIIPLAHKLWAWIYQCTYGLLAQTDFVPGTRHVFILGQFTSLGGIPLVVLTVSGALTLLVARKRRTEATALWLYAGLSLLPVVMGALTLNNDIRYYYTPFFFLLFALAVTNLRTELPFSAIRAVVVCGVIAFNVAGATAILTHRDLPYHARSFELLLRPDPESPRQLKVLEAIKRHIFPSKPLAFGIVQPFPVHPYHQLTDGELLSILSAEQGLPWQFLRPVFENQTREQSLQDLSAQYDYLLVGPRNPEVFHNARLSARTENSAALASYFLRTADNRAALSRIGFEITGEIPVHYSNEDISSFVLLKNIRARH